MKVIEWTFFVIFQGLVNILFVVFVLVGLILLINTMMWEIFKLLKGGW